MQNCKRRTDLQGSARRFLPLFLAVVISEFHALEIVFHGWPDLAFQLETVGGMGAQRVVRVGSRHEQVVLAVVIGEERHWYNPLTVSGPAISAVSTSLRQGSRQ